MCSKAPILHQLDVTDRTSVEKLGDFLKSYYGGLDVLVNNAGVMFDRGSSVSYVDQAETVFAVNYFGILNTSHILHPLLRPSARVVHVSSMLGHLSRIPSPELRKRFNSKTLTEDELTALVNEFLSAARQNTNEILGWGLSSYNVSKVAVAALSFLQQRQFSVDLREDLIVNSVHPGYVKTDLTRQKGPLSPEQGADCPAYLAMLPREDPNNPKGQFVWWNRKVVQWDSDKMPKD